MLGRAGITLVNAFDCHSFAELKRAYRRLEKPVVLKALGSVHKTERDLIYLGVESLAELRFAYKKLKHNAGPNPDCFLLQEQKKGVELIIGGHRDPVFGPVILFGTGGVLTELYGDVSMRVAPLSKKDAGELIEETRASAFLSPTGFREKKAHKETVTELLLKSSKLLLNEDVREFDFNPVIVTDKEAFIVDARLMA